MKTPEKLLHFPEGSILEDVVDYANRTAIYPQPQFAVCTGLMLGATICGRNYCTDQKNFTNLNIVELGLTSAGKERGRGVIEELMRKALLDEHLLGPSNYTSAGGVYSALLRRPSQLTIIDEFGRVLKANKRSQNSNSDTAVTTLMQLFGLANGVYRPQGYSEVNKRKNKDDENSELPSIVHPCVSILAITTPETFWSSVNGENIEDGFLPRFLIVESEMPLTEKRDVEDIEPSKKLIGWMTKHAYPIDNNLYKRDGGEAYRIPERAPDPIVIPFSKEAIKLRREFDKKIVNIRNNEKDYVLNCMWGKTEEIARRISLVVALSCDHKEITATDYTWARDFVDYYTNLAVKEAKYKVCDSLTLAISNAVWRLIEKSGDEGLTERELSQHCWEYRQLNTRQRMTIRDMVKADHGIEYKPKINGTKRDVWISEEVCDKISGVKT